MPPQRVEGPEGGAGGVSGPGEALVAQAHGIPVQEGVRDLGRQLGAEIGGVVLRSDEPRGVVHLDLQVGQGVEQRGVGHGDLVGNVVEGVDGTPVHGRHRRQVGRGGQELSCERKRLFS